MATQEQTDLINSKALRTSFWTLRAAAGIISWTTALGIPFPQWPSEEAQLQPEDTPSYFCEGAKRTFHRHTQFRSRDITWGYNHHWKWQIPYMSFEKKTFLTRLSEGNPAYSGRWEKSAFQPGAELHTSHPLSFPAERDVSIGSPLTPTPTSAPLHLQLLQARSPGPYISNFSWSHDELGVCLKIRVVVEKNVRNEKAGSPPALQQLGPG